MQGNRIGQNHMSVVATDEHMCVASQRIDQFFRRIDRRSPFRLVPITAQNPLAIRRILSAFGNPVSELLFAGGIVQLDAIELQSTADKVDMSVIEPGQEQLSSRINDMRSWTAP